MTRQDLEQLACFMIPNPDGVIIWTADNVTIGEQNENIDTVVMAFQIGVERHTFVRLFRLDFANEWLLQLDLVRYEFDLFVVENGLVELSYLSAKPWFKIFQRLIR